MPFELGLNDVSLAFNYHLQLTADQIKLSTGGILNSNSFYLEQFQSSTIPDVCSSLPRAFASSRPRFPMFWPLREDSHRSASTSSSEPNLCPHSRKRKPSSSDEDADSAPREPKQVQGEKAAHKMVEKKYRMNLNEKIAALRGSIVAMLQQAQWKHRFGGNVFLLRVLRTKVRETTESQNTIYLCGR
jgi:hypothetical protein